MTTSTVRPSERARRAFAAKLLAAATLALLVGIAEAQPAFDAAARRTVVENAAEALRSRYVYPDVGERAALKLESALAAGEYDELTDSAAFANRLTADLAAVANDKHLRVSAFGQTFVDPGRAAEPPRSEAGRTGWGAAAVMVPAPPTSARCLASQPVP